MKTLLMITVCNQHKERIINQLENLKKHEKYLKEHNILPLFVYGSTDIEIDVSPYKKLQVNVEERYTNLYKKIFEAFESSLQYEFDYLIKIDDDTLFNINLYDVANITDNYTAEYVGRFLPNFTNNYVLIHIPMFNIHIYRKFYPEIFVEGFSFATGDLYILSRRSVELLAKSKSELFDSCNEQEYICEDQLVGFVLKQDPTIVHKDITFASHEVPKTREHLVKTFQITSNLMSIHPIHTNHFNSLIGLNPTKQLELILSNTNENTSSVIYRKGLLDKFQKDVSDVVFNFVNHKKIMGLG